VGLVLLVGVCLLKLVASGVVSEFFPLLLVEGLSRSGVFRELSEFLDRGDAKRI
jgi:hypothetical protein